VKAPTAIDKLVQRAVKELVPLAERTARGPCGTSGVL